MFFNVPISEFYIKGQLIGLIRMVKRGSIPVKNRCITRQQFACIYLHSQIVLALARVPLCNRKTLAPYMRTYLKQSSVHLQMISFIFMGCKRQTITLYMGNKQFNRAWKVFIATWHLLKKISSYIQILIIKTFCFAKNASVDLGCFSNIELCGGHLHFIRRMNLQIFCNKHAHTFFLILHAHLRLFWCSIKNFRYRFRTRYKSNTKEGANHANKFRCLIGFQSILNGIKPHASVKCTV